MSWIRLYFQNCQCLCFGNNTSIIGVYASPRQIVGGLVSVAVAAHIITPAPIYLDRGKTRLNMEGA